MAVRYPVKEAGIAGYPHHELRWNPTQDCLDVWLILEGDRYESGGEVLKARIPFDALAAFSAELMLNWAAEGIVLKVSPEIKEKLFAGTLELRGDHKLYYDRRTNELWFTRLEAKDAD